jgi:hypothetical protein
MWLFRPIFVNTISLRWSILPSPLASIANTPVPAPSPSGFVLLATPHHVKIHVGLIELCNVQTHAVEIKRGGFFISSE